MAITHQDIVDRREALHREGRAEVEQVQARVDARVRKELDSLRELCGDIGHVFAQSPFYEFGRKPGRCCVFCMGSEPAPAP